MFLNATDLLLRYFYILTTVHIGSSLATTATQTHQIISQAMNESHLTVYQKIDFISLLTQLRSRNFNVQNDIFIINWNVLLQVRQNFRKIKVTSKVFSDDRNNCYIFDHFMSGRVVVSLSSS